ncbi:F-box family protein [Rhynchospora pubera]|uniref:F-box family protein n=1 Tax=Rhynchospora pubera TaxID=906938 RepID=A0AAV8G1C1_9POAL|nr:F-box family protein [Rhynchospora pubera]
MEASDLISCYEKGIERSMNEDLLIEILARLPLKSLSRFKCVSKSWHRLISDKYLQQKLPLISTGVFFRSESDQFKEPRYAYTAADGVIEDSQLDFFPFHEKSTIVDGCNGLLLYYRPAPVTFYVVNTTTKKWVSLPRPQKITQLSILAFDPYSSPEFKVLCFTAWRARGAELEIYSSKTGSWDQHEIQFGIETDAISATMHYFNNVLYILAYPNRVVAVNLTKITCNLIKLPEPMNRDGRVGHSQGHLHYAYIDENKLKIWMLKDAKRSEWALKHETSVRQFIGTREIKPNILAFHPEKELVYIWVPWKMVSYNLRERRLEGMWKFDKERGKAYLIQIWLFPCSSFLTKCLA